MATEVSFFPKSFSQLYAVELYTILQLRAEIFVVEQNCPYQDIDGKDANALHILGKKGNEIIAYARCFPPGFYFWEAAIGRVLVRADFRGAGYGHRLVQGAVSALYKESGPVKIRVSAQRHLIDFYEVHGFRTVGKGYLEDGIPHIAMVRETLSR